MTAARKGTPRRAGTGEPTQRGRANGPGGRNRRARVGNHPGMNPPRPSETSHNRNESIFWGLAQVDRWRQKLVHQLPSWMFNPGGNTSARITSGKKPREGRCVPAKAQKGRTDHWLRCRDRRMAARKRAQGDHQAAALAAAPSASSSSVAISASARAFHFSEGMELRSRQSRTWWTLTPRREATSASLPIRAIMSA